MRTHKRTVPLCLITSDSETAAPGHEGGDGANAGAVGSFGEIEPFAVKTVGTPSELIAALETAKSGDTIRLTANINYTSQLTVSGKSVTIDLDRKYKLTVNTSEANALYLRDDGEVKLVGEVPGTAEFNVTATELDYAGIYAFDNCKGAAVTNATGGYAGVYAIGGKITVSGDAKGTGTDSCGVIAETGATVSVGGNVTGDGYGALAWSVDHKGKVASINVKGNVLATGSESFAIGAYKGASVTVGGNASGGSYGAHASDAGSFIIVGGNVVATGSDSNAVSAYEGASITVGGNATGESMGVSAGSKSSIKVSGDATGGLCGISAVDVGTSVIVGGDATGTNDEGVNAASGAFVTVGGDATGGGIGAYAMNAGSSVKVGGDAKGTGTGSYGVLAYSGAFVTVGGDATGDNRGASATVVGSAITVLGDAKGGYCGAEALDGAAVIVRGDVTGGNFGVRTSLSGSPTTDVTTVTVDGAIFANGTYAYVGSGYRPKESAEPVSSKEGYIEYSNNNFYVWVRDKQGVPPVLSITPSHAILTKIADSATFMAKLDTDDIDLSKFEWEVTNDNGSSVNALLINTSPSDGKGTNTFTISLRTLAISGGASYSWIVTATYDDIYTAAATVEVMPGGLKPGDPSVPGNTTVKLLESKAQVNTAKDRGALVPVLITNRNVAALGVMAAGEVSAMETARTGADLDAKIELVTKDKKGEWVPVPRDRMTARWYKPDARYIEINALKGAKSLNDVYVKIVPNVGSGEIVAIGKLNITVTEKYPKITLKTDGSLNMALPGDSVQLTATSDDGKCEVISAASVKDADIGKVIFSGGKLALDPAKAKAGTVSMAVEVWVEGYKTPYLKTPTISVKIANASPKLKLSQKSVTLAGGTKWSAEPAYIYILSNDKNVPTKALLAKIDSVTFDGNMVNGSKYAPLSSLNYYEEGGELEIKRNAAAVSGKGDVVVTFIGGHEVRLPLTLNMLKPEDLTVTSKKSAVTINMNHTNIAPGNGVIADIPVTVNADNVFETDWGIKRVVEAGKSTAYNTHTHKEAFKTSTPHLDNNVTLSVDKHGEFSDWFTDDNGMLKNKKVDLYIGSSTVGSGKEFKLTMNMTSGTHGGALKVSNSGKINVADPCAFVTVTLTLKNTSSHINDIDWSKGGCDVSDFELVSYGKDSFKVMLKPGRANNIKMEAQTISPEIILENGNVISLPIKLTPVYTKSKATQSAKAVTIYKGTPQTGADIVLDITSPPGAEFGAAVINQASVDKLNLGWLQGVGVERDVFELTQCGKNKYTLSLTDKRNLPVQLIASGANKGKPVKNADGTTNKVAASKSYAVQIELWAKGSYLTNSDGSPKYVEGAPVPLKNSTGAAKTGPTLVTVKIDLK